MFYRGTLASNVESILENGLRPRGKKKSHDAYLQRDSYPEFSYLTSNPVLAADYIVRVTERVYNAAPSTILQINATGLDKSLMYPDEDYLSEVWNSDMCDWTHKDPWRPSRSYRCFQGKGRFQGERGCRLRLTHHGE
jgi:hypothetical protein